MPLFCGGTAVCKCVFVWKLVKQWVVKQKTTQGHVSLGWYVFVQILVKVKHDFGN